jgi:cytochrome P450
VSVTFEHLEAAYYQDPHSVHERLRAQGPVVPVVMPDGMPAWLVTRYDDVRAALADPRLCKDWRKIVPAEQQSSLDSAEGILGIHMLNSDPPDHERLRRLVTRAFTPRRVEQLRPRVEEITRSLLSGMVTDREVDLLEVFAFPLPVIVISELLGVPAADREQFRAWSAVVVSSSAEPGDVAAMATAMISYFTELIAAKRHTPGDDLLSALLQVRDASDRLTEAELLGMIFLLLVAGHETTVNLIASGVLALLLDPAQLARLAADRSLLPAAVEELLRYVSPVNNATLRFTTAPTSIGGVEIPERQVVLVSLSSANRDPERYGSPDALDIGRDTGGHVAFGHGIHYCLGAPLARLEAEIAFGGLLDTFPGMTLAVPAAELRWRASSLIRGLESLPVRLSSPLITVDHR